MRVEAWANTEFVLDDEGNMNLRVLPEPRRRVERAPLPRHRTRSDRGIGNAWGFTGHEGEEPKPATEKEKRVFGVKQRRTSIGCVASARKARSTMLEQFDALGEERMRYGRKTLVSLDETIRGKSKKMAHWQWRCDCGAPGFVPCIYWARRHERVGTECASCSRHSTLNKRNGGRPRGARNGL